MKADFLNDLNDSQRQAVLYNDGASLVIAGAGSGKTRVLTCKIAYLLQLGYRSDSIMALTFTNKAAREMKERISRLVGDQSARYLWMGTFHSIFLRILRVNAQVLGYSPQLTIYDTSDSKSLIHSIIKEMNLSDKDYADNKVLSRISRLKNKLILPDDYERDKSAIIGDEKNNFGMFYLIYQMYQNRCKLADAMDFDDILVNTYLLFGTYPEVLATYVDRFKYILVDEYQDTNYVQRQIVLQLGVPHQHVCVVGDDAQSIYSFRGANIDNILSFTKDFKDAKLFKLEQNYRSTQNIVLAANSVIAKNQHQIQKSIFSQKEVGEKIRLTKAYSDIEEAAIVVKNINNIHRKEDMPFSDFAILYRTNAQSRVFEEELRKLALPYKIYGGLSFYQRKEIKDVIAYFRLIVNPNDEEALKRIINYPVRGIGDTTLNKIKASAIQHQVSLWTVLGNPALYGVDLNKGKISTLYTFFMMIQGLAERVATEDADVIGAEAIRESGLMSITLNDMTADKERKENMGELVTGMSDFVASHKEDGDVHVSLANYLSEISLLTDQDAGKDEEVQEKVTLMTIHAAKGLEFATVFIVGLEENLFPSYMCMDNERALEEERRLFYVAITRAERHCFLSYAESRFHFGKMEFAQPSRFLKDIDSKYLSFPNTQSLRDDVDSRASKFRPIFERSKPNFSGHSFSSSSSGTSEKVEHTTGRNYRPVVSSAPISDKSASIDPNIAERLNLKVGQLIEHERFGMGEVKHIEGTDENRKATIEFRNLGVKVLLLRFARFKVIG